MLGIIKHIFHFGISQEVKNEIHSLSDSRMVWNDHRLKDGLDSIISQSDLNDVIATTSSSLLKNTIVSRILNRPIKPYKAFLPCRTLSTIGWGRKPSGQQAIAISSKRNIPYLLLEDGFIRSIHRHDPSLSLVLDSEGIYYDASSVSNLECHIAEKLTISEETRAKDIIKSWKQLRLSKYNANPDFDEDLPFDYVLVVDQVRGDSSIGYGLADANTFQHMLKAAIYENPDKTVIVKIHPDVYTNSALSHFSPQILESTKRVKVVASNCHPVRLIENAQAVYTVTSQVGFEALIWGKYVRTFGMPFYAGWGLTTDEHESPERRGKASLEQLVHASLVKYTRYINPLTEQHCQVEEVFKFISTQRRYQTYANNTLVAIGFSRWKKPFIRNYLQNARIKFRRRISELTIQSSSLLVIWGNKFDKQLRHRSNVLRLEDGFLRSSGLGADLVRPLSIVVDDVGIYYDATKPSKLENILNQQTLSQEELTRASQLARKIIELRVTKYNIGISVWERPKNTESVILIVGQVEDDESIKFGSPAVKSNIDLIKQVRSTNPHAFLLYKPHPDVLARLRRKGQLEDSAASLCNQIIGNVDADSLFNQIDELHTMTSLMGFEALLRGVSVVCHGIPFYSGWGLTTDKISCNRRTRQLSLDELVFGALITYPSYMHAEKPCFIEPEDAVDQLHDLITNKPRKNERQRSFIRLGAIAQTYRRRSTNP